MAKDKNTKYEGLKNKLAHAGKILAIIGVVVIFFILDKKLYPNSSRYMLFLRVNVLAFLVLRVCKLNT